MPLIMVDIILFLLTLGITYALMSEGLWGSALMFFNVLFAALIALNFYEPVAALMVDNLSFMANFADMTALMLLFIIPLLLLRLTTETIAPAMVRFPTPVYHLGRVVFAAGAAVIAVGFIMLAFQTSPTQKQLVGSVDYKYEPRFFLGERFDRDLLGFFQYTTGYTFARNGVGGTDPEFAAKPMLFDPKGDWLIRYQEVRPYGTGPILHDEPAAPGTPATPGGGGGETAGAAPGAAPGRPGP